MNHEEAENQRGAGNREVGQGREERRGRGEGKRRESLRLTDRDRQLMAMLATVRYLSGEQLGRLLFAERSGINLNKRLLALGGEGKHGLEPTYLKRLSYRSWDGVEQSART